MINTSHWDLMEFYNQGIIEALADRGLMSTKVLAYFQYYETFVRYKDNHHTFRHAILCTSVDHKVSQETVKRAVRMVQGKGSKM